MSLDPEAAGVITLGGKAYSMDTNHAYGPNSWIFVDLCLSDAILLRDEKGNPFSYVAARRSFGSRFVKDTDPVPSSLDGLVLGGAWFGTAIIDHSEKHSALFSLGACRAYTVSHLGIAGLDAAGEARLAEEIVVRARAAWSKSHPDKGARP